MTSFKNLVQLCLINWCTPTKAHPSLPQILSRREDLPVANDLSWVDTYAAIGDSYAAGIGAGKPLETKEDRDCKRYDGAYPVLINESFFQNTTFQFLACSGDQSSHVQDQIKQIADDSQDLVTISAGGNDALLSDLLRACIYAPTGEAHCVDAMRKTQDIIDNKLEKGVNEMLQALAPKVKKDGVVIYTLYAQFFNDKTDDCDHTTWDFWSEVFKGGQKLPLKKELRTVLNDLVVDANQKITNAIAGQSGSTRPSNLHIAIVDWDDSAGKRGGRFCEQNAKNDPKDNPDLMFQRGMSDPSFIPIGKKRSLLHKRVPEEMQKIFHPTARAHEMISAMSIGALVELLIDKLGRQAPDSCSLVKPNPPSCAARTNKGIDKHLFEEARNEWCRDTTKGIDPSKEYAGYFSLEYNVINAKGNCAFGDCVDMLNNLWATCADDASRPSYDISPLSGKNGPLRGYGQAQSRCGTYNFKVKDPEPTCGQKPEQVACTGVYEVQFEQSLKGKDPNPLISWEVFADGSGKSYGTGFANQWEFDLMLGGHDGLKVEHFRKKKKDTRLRFTWFNSDNGQKDPRTYHDGQEDGNTFHCGKPRKSDNNEKRLIRCRFNAYDMWQRATGQK